MTTTEAPPHADPISWETAEQVARRLLRSSPLLDLSTLRRLDEDFAEATAHGEHLVEEATGLYSHEGKARCRVTDRAGWVEANVGSFQRLLRPLTDALTSQDEDSPRVVGQASQSIAGVEVGIVLSWMARLVLGQYDLLPVDNADSGDILYYVGPNIVFLERRNGFPPREFRLWIALHELTHRTQFTAVPWMRDYFFGLIERGVGIITPDGASKRIRIESLIADVRAGKNPLAENGLVGLLASPEQQATLKEAQALMSLLEGHGNFIMTLAGADEIPGAKRFARVLAERRTNTRGLAKVMQQLLGIDAKLRQYSEGERFIEAVMKVGGDELFSQVWSGSEKLPTLEEIRAPELWVERVGGHAPSAV